MPAYQAVRNNPSAERQVFGTADAVVVYTPASPDYPPEVVAVVKDVATAMLITAALNGV